MPAFKPYDPLGPEEVQEYVHRHRDALLARVEEVGFARTAHEAGVMPHSLARIAPSRVASNGSHPAADPPPSEEEPRQQEPPLPQVHDSRSEEQRQAEEAPAMSREHESRAALDALAARIGTCPDDLAFSSFLDQHDQVVHAAVQEFLHRDVAEAIGVTLPALRGWVRQYERRERPFQRRMATEPAQAEDETDGQAPHDPPTTERDIPLVEHRGPAPEAPPRHHLERVLEARMALIGELRAALARFTNVLSQRPTSTTEGLRDLVPHLLEESRRQLATAHQEAALLDWQGNGPQEPAEAEF